MGRKFPIGNPGRPKGIQNRLTKHRESLDKVMTAERQQAMWAAMLKKAIGGDVAAARLIVEYLLGKAPQPVTLDGTIEHQHHAIPGDELRDIALRSAKRLVEQNRLELATKRAEAAKSGGNGAPKGDSIVDLSTRVIPKLPSEIEQSPGVEPPPLEGGFLATEPPEIEPPPELPESEDIA